MEQDKMDELIQAIILDIMSDGKARTTRQIQKEVKKKLKKIKKMLDIYESL